MYSFWIKKKKDKQALIISYNLYLFPNILKCKLVDTVNLRFKNQILKVVSGMFSNVFLPGSPGHFEIEISEVLNWLG